MTQFNIPSTRLGWPYGAYDRQQTSMPQEAGVIETLTSLWTQTWPDYPDALLVGDVDGDGELEVVLPAGTDTHVLDGRTGALKRTIAPVAFPLAYPLLLADVNNDGALEIFITDYTNRMGVFSGLTGLPLWQNLAVTVSGISAEDVNGDGYLELIIANYTGMTTQVLNGQTGAVILNLAQPLAAHAYVNPQAVDLLGTGQFSYVSHGHTPTGECFTLWDSSGAEVWHRSVNYHCYLQPMFAAFLNDGKKYLVSGGDEAIFCLDPADGSIVWIHATGMADDLPTNTYFYIGPAAFGDVDGDGVIEIVFQATDTAGPAAAHGVWALRGTDGTVAWHRPLAAPNGWMTGWRPPVLVDLDGDELLEVLCIENVLPYAASHMYVLDAAGNLKSTFSQTVGAHQFINPVAADLNGDGYLEVLLLDVLGTTLFAMGDPASAWEHLHAGVGGNEPMTNVVPVVGTNLLNEQDSAVRLARYFQLTGYSEESGFGVFDGTNPDAACNPIWTQSQRAMMVKYLREAQEEIEQVTHYPLAPRWIVGEQHPWGGLVHSDWTKVLEAGVRATTVIAAGAVVAYGTEPAVIGPLATTVTDPDEVYITHPGTTMEIMPSKITIAAGFVTIEVPRCRMVKSALQDNPDSGLDYNDVTNFEVTVDVIRVYNDPTTQGTLVYPHQSSASSCSCETCGRCEEFTETACLYIRNGRTGAVDVMSAAQAGGVWTPRTCACYCALPQLVRLNYRAGLADLTPQAEDAVLRLAHAKMPSAPCGCGPISDLWARDRHTPDVLTAERENCPFGMSDGAWIAWRFANAMTQHRVRVL